MKHVFNTVDMMKNDEERCRVMENTENEET